MAKKSTSSRADPGWHEQVYRRLVLRPWHRLYRPAPRLQIARAGVSQTTAALADLFTFLEAFEGWARPDRWKAADMDLWPIAKFLAVSHILKHTANPRALHRSLAINARRAAAESQDQALDPGSGAELLRWEPTRGSASLFVGNYTTFKELGGLGIQLNYDYLRMALERVGHETHSLLSGVTDAELGSIPSLLPHASFHDAVEASRSSYRTYPLFDGQFGVEELIRFLCRRLGIKAADYFRANFNLAASRALDAAAAWEARLRSAPPKACYLYAYANPLGWGLALACRRLGIPCYEIQHGVEGRMHGAYHWTRVPADGWTTVPRGRLVWTPAERGTMDRAFTTHLVGPGSLRTIAMIMDERGSAAEGPLAKARESLLRDAQQLWQAQAPDGRPRVLFLSQRTAGLEWLERLASDERYRCFFRFHPSQSELLAQAGENPLFASAQAEASTRLPLPLVMAGVDVLLSHSSAGFLEGRYFGLPSVFLSDYVRTLHQTYGSADLYESSPERCGDDLAAIRPKDMPPMDSLAAMITSLPDISDVVATLA